MSEEAYQKSAAEIVNFSQEVLHNVMFAAQNTAIATENIPFVFISSLIALLMEMRIRHAEFGDQTAQRCITSLVTSLKLNNFNVTATVPDLTPEEAKDAVMHNVMGPPLGRA